VGFINQSPPHDDLSWGLAATEGATSWVHMDDDGLATVIVVKTGVKWWVVLKPRKDSSGDVLSGDLGTSKAYPLSWSVEETSGKNNFDAEGVLLPAGSVL